MQPSCYFHLPDGNTYTVTLSQLASLQEIVAGVEAVTYPLFLRVGARPVDHLQPVTARALLAEIERFVPFLESVFVPGIQFRDAAGQVLGRIHAGREGQELASGLFGEPAGIRLVVSLFPPPVGFRSRPGLPPNQYECFFAQIRRTAKGFQGLRTDAMGGSGRPVDLPDLPLPPVTRWDFATTTDESAVSLLEPIETPAREVYRDVIHWVSTACSDSVRLKLPLEIRRD